MVPGFIFASALRVVPREERLQILRNRVRQAIALGVSVAMLSLSKLVAFGSPSRNTGLITFNGTVVINGAEEASGQTVFSGSTVSTDKESESVIIFRNSGRLKLEAGTTLSLGFSESSLSGSLKEGSVSYSSPAGVRADITTADGAIVADPGQPAQFRIQVEECNTNLSVQTG